MSKLTLKPKFRCFPKNKEGKASYVYEVVGSHSAIEDYIRTRTELGDNPMKLESILSKDDGVTPVYFSNKLIDYKTATINLTPKGGCFINNEIADAMEIAATQMGEAALQHFYSKQLDKSAELLSEIIALSNSNAEHVSA